MWRIQWRNDFEQHHLEQSIQQWHARAFPDRELEAWLLGDIVVVCKKVTERLRFLQATFDAKHIIKWVGHLYCFLWGHSWCEEEDFEAAICHVLTLIDNVGFPLVVTRHVVGEETAPAPAPDLSTLFECAR